jgi:hypothetical protein
MAILNNDKIVIGIDNEVVELTGDDLTIFKADQLLRQESIKTETENNLAKKQAILDRLGITLEEAQVLGL